MSTRTLGPLVVTALTALLLCSPASAQTGRRNTASDPDMKELAAYTLTMDSLNKIDRVNRDLAAALEKDPKYGERIRIGKELAQLKAKSETTPADDKRIEELEARADKLDEANDAKDSSDAKTLSEMEQKINSIPPMAGALRQEGVSARDYAKFMLAMMQAGFAAAAQQMSAKSGKPMQLPEGINPANVKFVQEHEAELKKMEEGYSALSAIR